MDDLDKYRVVVERIKEAAIKIDLAVDSLPGGHPHRENPRYRREMLDQDVQNEDDHLARIEDLLVDQGELRERLAELDDETGDPPT